MKPRSKEEIKVYNLSKRLKRITDTQLNWGKSLFDNYMYQTKTKSICFECNHTFNQTGDNLTCPNCNSKLKLLLDKTPTGRTRTKYDDYYYFYVLTVIDEYQVIRCIRINKYINIKTKPYFEWSETFRYWINVNGKVTLMSKNVRPFGYYNFDQWDHNSKISIKRNYSVFTIIPGVIIYPKKKILHILKRNGYNGEYFDSHLPTLLKLLIINPHVETIVKAGYINLLRIQNKSDILRGVKSRLEEFDEYWPQIKMVMRYKYKIDDVDMWFDHLRMLKYVKKDILNLKHILPENLNEEHTKLNRLIERRREKEYSKLRRKHEEERIKRLEKDEKNYLKSKSKYFDIELSHDKFKVVVLKSLNEFKEEGKKLIHCVYSSVYYNKQDSLILSARINNEPIETIEFSLSEKRVIQSHGTRNDDSELHDEIITFINSNAKTILNKKRKRNEKRQETYQETCNY